LRFVRAAPFSILGSSSGSHRRRWRRAPWRRAGRFLAPMAPGTLHAMVERPFDIQARVRRVGGVEPRHPHLREPVVDGGRCRRGPGGAGIGTMRAGAIGNRSSVLPCSSSCAKSPGLELGGLVLEMAVESGCQASRLRRCPLQANRDVVVAVDFGRNRWIWMICLSPGD